MLFEEMSFLKLEDILIFDGYNIEENPAGALLQAKFSQCFQQLLLESFHQLQQQPPLLDHENQGLSASDQLS
jgi:hypothetical protein